MKNCDIIANPERPCLVIVLVQVWGNIERENFNNSTRNKTEYLAIVIFSVMLLPKS